MRRSVRGCHGGTSASRYPEVDEEWLAEARQAQQQLIHAQYQSLPGGVPPCRAAPGPAAAPSTFGCCTGAQRPHSSPTRPEILPVRAAGARTGRAGRQRHLARSLAGPRVRSSSSLMHRHQGACPGHAWPACATRQDVVMRGVAQWKPPPLRYSRPGSTAEAW